LEADRARDQALAQLGLNVLRFDNRQILTKIGGVVEKIYCVVNLRLESP